MTVLTLLIYDCGLCFLDLIVLGEGKCGDGDWDGEKSFLIFGISEKQASEIGKEFEQNAIVWCDKDAIPQLLLLK